MKPRFSLIKKTVIAIILLCLVLIVSSVVVCGRVQARLIDRQYKDDVSELAKTIAEVIDKDQFARFKAKVYAIYERSSLRPTSEEWGSDKFYAYTAQFSELYDDPDYIELLAFLRKIQSANKIDCVYTIFVDTANSKAIYVVDADLEDPCPIGCIDPLYVELTSPIRGFEPYYTDTEAYGRLISAGMPIIGNDGDNSESILGYAYADNSLNDIRKEQLDTILKLAVYLTLAAVTAAVIIVILVNKHVIKPLENLSDAAYAYCHDETAVLRNKFSSLTTKSNDEIKTLTDSMKKMEEELNQHIAKLFTANNELLVSKDEADKMKILATKDALTGIRNKTAYDYEIKQIEKKIQEGGAKFGIAMIDLNFLKQTNDNHGHECGDQALIRLSKLICSVFVHSPVFRVGGDEFTVLLENNDYDKIDELAAEFRSKIDKMYNNTDLKPWERISAALGYSIFDPEKDDDAADVFRRADEEMYARKRKMKEGGVTPIL